jgi:hypothetical protein
MPLKNKISWGEDSFTHTRSPPQPSIPTAGPSPRVAENGSTTSSGLTRTSCGFRKLFRGQCSRRQIAMTSPMANFSNILTPGGYFTGTWAYIPPGAAVPASSSTRAITAAEDLAAEDLAAQEPVAQEPAAPEPAAETPAAPAQLASLRLPLNPVCSVCDQEVENMQTVQDVGNVCLGCLCHNTRRA